MKKITSANPFSHVVSKCHQVADEKRESGSTKKKERLVSAMASSQLKGERPSGEGAQNNRGIYGV